MSEPIQLLKFDGKNYVPVKEALEELQKYGKVILISINGNYRGGKSTLANYIYGDSSDKRNFEVGGSVRPKTKGIWMRAKPHPYDRKKTLIILDVEGLDDAMKNDKTMDVKLFCLAFLLSTVVLYNARGELTDTTMEKLLVVTQLSKYITEKEERNRRRLLLVLRDFDLDLLDENEDPISADTYLEDTLKSNTASGPSIKECFPSRKCITLPQPTGDKQKRKNLGSVPVTELDKEFQEDLHHLIQYVNKETVNSDFTIDGVEITGPRLALLIGEYTKSINDNKTINIKSTFLMVKEIECRKAVDEASKQYKTEMRGFERQYPVDDSEFQKQHEKAMQKALNFYKEKATLDKEGIYLAELEDEICEQCKHSRKNNEIKQKEEQMKKEKEKREREKEEEQRKRKEEMEQQQRKHKEEMEQQQRKRKEEIEEQQRKHKEEMEQQKREEEEKRKQERENYERQIQSNNFQQGLALATEVAKVVGFLMAPNEIVHTFPTEIAVTHNIQKANNGRQSKANQKK